VWEVVDQHRPDVLYFDAKMDWIDELHRLEFMLYYYNSGAPPPRPLLPCVSRAAIHYHTPLSPHHQLRATRLARTGLARPPSTA
jgi:hypothetical protein